MEESEWWAVPVEKFGLGASDFNGTDRNTDKLFPLDNNLSDSLRVQYN